jgi:bacterial/archaeal transporter family-2 protein
MEAWSIPLLLVVGALLAVQAAANVQLSAAMRSPLGASTVQLGVAFALLSAAALATGAGDAVGLLAGATWWHLLGGLGSALYVTAGILLFPRIGAVVSVGLFITGQVLASLVLDTAGWLGVRAQPLGAVNLVGALAVLVGAALIVRAQERITALAVPRSAAGPGAATAPVRPGLLVRERVRWWVLGVLAGAGLPVQGAVNAQLRLDVGSPAVVASVSFLVAAAALALVLAVAVGLGAARPRLGQLGAVPWWGWLGGLVGAVYVTAVFLLLPRIGAAPTIALTVAGQQLAGVAVDQYGLLRLPRRPVTAHRLLGVGVLLSGVALLQLP